MTANTRPYHESVTLVGSRLSGMTNFPLTIDGQGATLDGTVGVPKGEWVFVRGNIFRYQPPRMGYQRLFLDGQAAVCIPPAAGSAIPPKLAPGQWTSLDGMIYFGVALSKLPDDYNLSMAALPTGITLFHVDYVRIQDLTIRGYQVDGLAAQNSAGGSCSAR